MKTESIPVDDLPATLEQMERQHILRTLERVGGNRQRAARVLGIGRATLYRKLERYAAQTLSPAERHVMAHATAWPDCYRNHFCASAGHDDWATIQGLCARGLMRVVRAPSELSGGDTVFAVTGEGFAALRAAPAEAGS